MTPTTVVLHIPKTAGTSLRASFQAAYPADRIAFVYEHAAVLGPTAAEFTDWPDERKLALDVVYGHLSYGFHRRLPGPARYLTVLRDPVDRVVSHYYHYVSAAADGRPAGAFGDLFRSGDLTLERFAAVDYPAGLPRVSSNLMTRIVGGVPLVADLSEPAAAKDALDQAMRHVDEDFIYVALAETIDSDIERIARSLGWPQVIPPTTANVNPGRPREPLDEHTAEAIRTNNDLDLALYEHVLTARP